MSGEQQLLNLKEGFAPLSNEFDDAKFGNQAKDALIHIRIQQRNGRKTLTTVQGINPQYDFKKIVKACKKEFACNGTVVEHPEYGEVVQLQGDQRDNIKCLLCKWGLATQDQVKVENKEVSVETSAALMTSDRGNSGGAELQLNTPVTPKSPGPGLNPNANVFLSSKSPASPDSVTPQWDSPGSDATFPSLSNGDVKLEQAAPAVGLGSSSASSSSSTGPTFPTAPDSPVSVTDFTATTPATATNYNDNQNAITNDNASVASTEDGSLPLEGSIPEDQLRQMLQTQLEYYFSRENLVHDTYLQSQMDPDQYVAIATVANFNQVQKLTNNLQLIVDVLRRSPSVQVDEKGEKVRPNHSRCVVILREVPDTTPVEEVQKLFTGGNCPPFVSCEFAHNNSWYVTFESDEDAQRAYQFLREEVRTFLDRPIMARIKAKPLIRSTYVPRNGIKPFQGTEQPSYPIPQPQQQQPQQAAQQQAPYRMVQPPSVQYINGQQPFSFYPLSPTVMPTWAPSATPAFLDPGAVSKFKMFQMNGYQATSIKPTTSSTRHVYQGNARNNRNTKTHRPAQDRNNSEGRMSNDRHTVSSAPRTSPRNSDNTQISAYPRRGDMGGNTHMANASIQPHGVDANANPTQSNKNDGGSQSQRKSYKRGRRGEEGAKNSVSSNQRPNPSMSGRDGRLEPQFELESTSFPPLPGSQTNAASSENFESKMSDVVKGTARLEVSTRKQVQQVHTSAPASQHPAARVTSPPPSAVTTPPSPSPVSPPPPPVVSPPTPSVKEAPEPTAVPVTTATATATVAITAEPVGQTKSSKATSSAETKPTPEPTVPKQASVVVSSQSKPTTSSVSVLSPEEKVSLPPGVKLSYAQMVQRKRDPDGNGNGVVEKTKDDTSPQQSPPPVATAVTSAKNGQTLREQTQTVKVASASARQPQMKENVRKDFEPKEQRPQGGRRAKENRERRDRRRDRSERDIKVAAK